MFSLNMVFIGISIFLPIEEANFYKGMNFIFSYDSMGIEYRFHPHYKMGGLVQYPQEINILSEKNVYLLISEKDYQIVGYRFIDKTKFYHPDFMLYMNFYPLKQYSFYINLFYKYFSSFSKNISSIPLDQNNREKYIPIDNYYLSSRISYISYNIFYNASNQWGAGFGYEYWITKRMFFNFMAGYYLSSFFDYPDKVIYFSDKSKWWFYLRESYQIIDLILQEYDIKNHLEKYDHINGYRFFLQFSLGIKIW